MDSFHPLITVDLRDGMGQIQRYAEIIQTLYLIPRKPRQIVHQLDHRQNLRALKCHPARHDHPDIPGTKDHDPFSHHLVLAVYEPLGGPGRVDSCRTTSRYHNIGPRPFSASHGKDDACRMDRRQTMLPVHTENLSFLLPDLKNHRIQQEFYAPFGRFLGESCRILWSRKLFLEICKSESGMDTLLQDPSDTLIPFDHQNFPGSLFLCCNGCR